MYKGRAVVVLGLSILLASTIAGPVHRLASAAERVRYGTKARAEIPDFTDRLLYTSDAADDLLRVYLGGLRITQNTN